MAVRSSLQKFLALFKELKAAAGNDPSVLSEFDKAPDELRAATRLNSFAKTLEEEIIYGPEKMIAHAPPEWASAWAEYKRSWEPRLDHFVMCEFDPEWPRDYEDHRNRYEATGVVPNEGDDLFVPGFHDGPAAIRRAIRYVNDHQTSNVGLSALRYLIDNVNLNLPEIMKRWERLPMIYMPEEVAKLQQISPIGPLTELFNDAVRAYVCGASAAALAMCRSLLETILKQSYVPEAKNNANLQDLLEVAGNEYDYVDTEKLRKLIKVSNSVLHRGGRLSSIVEDDLIGYFEILKLLIERAPSK